MDVLDVGKTSDKVSSDRIAKQHLPTKNDEGPLGQGILIESLFKLFVLKVALVEDVRFAEDVGSQLNQSVIHGTKIKAMDLAPRH